MVTIPDDIDEEARTFFQENGYWISPPLIGNEILVELVEHYSRVLNGDYETTIEPLKRSHAPVHIDTGVVKITNCYLSDSLLSRLILSPAIGKLACFLLGTDAVRYWRDHLWYKPPQSGDKSNVGWHQDYKYWQCVTPASLITAWIALKDVTEDNGCLEYLPGSHTWGVLPEGDLYSHDMDALKERIVSSSNKPFSPIPAIMPAGSISFHHCLTVHGSRQNLSKSPRLSISVHYMPEGARYQAGTENDSFLNVRFLSGKDGDPFLGPFFPVVYREGHLSSPWDMGT